MNILLFGKNGQVGWELQRALSPLGKVTALSRESTLCGDLTDLDGIERTIFSLKPDVVVNAAAYTAVDKAETEQNLAQKINSAAPERMAKACASIDSLLLHYSTDYVFNGKSSHAWSEADNPDPLNCYGKTKFAAEKAIMSSGCSYLIFRTSWVYATRGNNFIKTLLKFAKERTAINIVADQIGVPTGADLLADISALSLKALTKDPQLRGLYHLAPSGATNWCDYARFIVEEAEKLGLSSLLKEINPIPSKEYKTAALRPLNSRLNCDKLQEAFGLHLDHWQTGVVRAIQEIAG